MFYRIGNFELKEVAYNHENQLKKPVYHDTVVGLVFLVFLFGITLDGLPGVLGRIGDGAILVILTVGMLFAVAQAYSFKISRKLIWVALSIFLLSMDYATILLVKGGGIKAVSVLAELLFVLMFFMGVVSIRWGKNSFRILGVGAFIFMTLIFALWVSAGFPGHFSAYLSHKNSLGGAIYGQLYFAIALLLVERKGVFYAISLITVFLSIVLLVATESRASMLALVVMGFTAILFKVIGKSRFRWKMYFYFVVISIALFTLVYPVLNEYVSTGEFSEVLSRYTGGRLYSGRNDIWPTLISAINMHPLWGNGAGALPKDFLDSNLSSHNLYIQLALQVGVVGLLLFLILLFSVWMVFWNGKNDLIVRLSSVYLIGIMAHQTFEVSMTQNKLSLGILYWLVLGIGVSRVIHSSKYSSRNMLFT